MRQYEKWQKNIDNHQRYTVVALTSIGMFLLLDAILSGFILPSWLLQLQAMPQVSMSWTLYEAFLSFFALNLAIVFTISVLIWKFSQNIHRHTSWNVQNFLAPLMHTVDHLPPSRSARKRMPDSPSPKMAFPLPSSFSFFREDAHPSLALHASHALNANTVSHPGIVRRHRPNEDASLQMIVTRRMPFNATQLVGLFVVADGMGGHNNGQEASSTLIATVRSHLENLVYNTKVSDEELKNHLVYAIQQASRILVQENEKQGIVRGTTVTGAVVVEQPSLLPWEKVSYIAHIVNVGDSRTYLYSQTRGFSRITHDHSIVELMIEQGLITPEERYTHRERNKIFRCIGDTSSVEVDAFTVAMQPGDRLLLCSDGLWEMVRDDDLAALISQPCNDPSIITTNQLNAAMNNGGQDNITAIVVIPEGDAK